MAEKDAAEPAPAQTPRTWRLTTAADVRSDVKRSVAPLLAAVEQAERSAAPFFAAAKAAQRYTAFFEGGIGEQLRQMFGEVDLAPRAPPKAPEESPPRSAGPNGPMVDSSSGGPTLQARAVVGPAASNISPAHPRVAWDDISPEAMSALVDRVAAVVVNQMAAPRTLGAGDQPAPAKSRRGRRQREITVSGVDAALEALAEGDPSVRTLAARALATRVQYSRRTIENCATYKAWRLTLKNLRIDAATSGMADAIDAGLARIRKKKPGRERLKDPTMDPATEKLAKAFLRFHAERDLDGQ